MLHIKSQNLLYKDTNGENQIPILDYFIEQYINIWPTVVTKLCNLSKWLALKSQHFYNYLFVNFPISKRGQIWKVKQLSVISEQIRIVGPITGKNGLAQLKSDENDKPGA